MWPFCKTAVAQSDSGHLQPAASVYSWLLLLRLMKSEAGGRLDQYKTEIMESSAMGGGGKNLNGQVNKGCGRSRRHFSSLATKKQFWKQSSAATNPQFARMA